MRVPLILLLIAAIVPASFATTVTETETVFLSGHGSDDPVQWDFYCTAGRNSGFWTKIGVPSCWEQQDFGEYEYGVESRPSKKLSPLPVPQEQGLYRHQFSVPASWRGRIVRLVFEGVMTDAEVKINGEPAGPIHQGAFYRFKYDITDKLRFDEPNLLEVTVSKHSANASVNHAERLGDYWNFGGIFRPVRLEALPAQFIDRVAVDARADGAFDADVFLGGAMTAGGEIVMQLKTFDGIPIGSVITQALPANTAKVAVHTQIQSPSTWTAETPALYQAEFTLRDGPTGPIRHVITQRFGFRTFELRPGDGLYLNGHKITLKGVNRHSFWPETGRTLSLVRQREDVRLLKEANMNAVRMSHYPPDAEFLDLCDEAGLYVLDELGGWHGSYDTATGKKLIAEMVTRDVNHPAILFWDNGNEGGENPANDDEFAKYDPQHRPVLHPWARSFRGMNTSHYREYAETAKFAEGPDIFMPTEFLHGLFDGGHGAGLDDFWAIMGEKPHAAGGFLWDWADEAVARADENGRLDAHRDLAPDGMVGPHHEKEGSYFTVRDIWSPVQIPVATLPADFNGTLPVRNRYDFLSLSAVTFQWQLVKFAPPGALLFHRTTLAQGRFNGPAIAARADGNLTLPLPANWRDADVLYVTAIDGRERAICSWSWQWKSGSEAIGHAIETKSGVNFSETAGEVMVSAGRNAVRISRSNGQIVALERDGRTVSLSGGPRLVAYRRVERGFVPLDIFAGKLVSFNVNHSGEDIVIDAACEGAMHSIRWTMAPDGDVRLDYEFTGPGMVDILGVDFDYPEEKMKSKEWLGVGPYRVWQNRLKGGTIARWDTAYNDSIPGVSWDYPEFKGWFAGWRWMAFTTTEGRFALLNNAGQPYVGVYAARDGTNNPVLVLPRLGLGVYQAISGIGTKNSTPASLGPQGQSQNITGVVKGSLVIRLLDQP